MSPISNETQYTKRFDLNIPASTMAADPSTFSRQLKVPFTESASDIAKETKICQYTLRGLKESEISHWAAFCADVFAYKSSPPPASYFERHYFNDPRRQASLIRVAVYQDEKGGQIVASCRIFRRTISNGSGGAIEAGGIGEVCTANDHRRRGLSKELLLDCLEIMRQQKNPSIQVSFLHAAPEFFPVYKSAGYVNTKTEWSVVQCQLSSLESSAKSFLLDSMLLRLARFPEDTAELHKIHGDLNERKYAGCIVRSHDYWNQYTSKELEGSLSVLLDENGLIMSWLSVRRKSDRIQMRDFGCIDCNRRGCQALTVLLSQAVGDLDLEANETFDLVIPTQVLSQVHESFEKCSNKDGNSFNAFIWDSMKVEEDLGWMYQPIGPDGFSMPDASQPHLIWPADSF